MGEIKVIPVVFTSEFFSSLKIFLKGDDKENVIFMEELAVTRALESALKKNGGRLKPTSIELGFSETKTHRLVREKGLSNLADDLRKNLKKQEK